MSKWFCKLCWREGELLAGPAHALREARAEHARDVARGMSAWRFPAGVHPLYSDAMEHHKFRGVDCPGDLAVGEAPNKKLRFEKDGMPLLFE